MLKDTFNASVGWPQQHLMTGVQHRQGCTSPVSGCAVCAVSVLWVCTCVTIAMAGWLHGVCVGAC